jgi:hypothetical protein
VRNETVVCLIEYHSQFLTVGAKQGAATGDDDTLDPFATTEAFFSGSVINFV